MVAEQQLQELNLSMLEAEQVRVWRFDTEQIQGCLQLMFDFQSMPTHSWCNFYLVNTIQTMVSDTGVLADCKHLYIWTSGHNKACWVNWQHCSWWVLTGSDWKMRQALLLFIPMISHLSQQKHVWEMRTVHADDKCINWIYLGWQTCTVCWGKALKQEKKAIHLAKEVIGGESIIVPDSNLQGFLFQLQLKSKDN